MKLLGNIDGNWATNEIDTKHHFKLPQQKITYQATLWEEKRHDCAQDLGRVRNRHNIPQIQ